MKASLRDRASCLGITLWIGLDSAVRRAGGGAMRAVERRHRRHIFIRSSRISTTPAPISRRGAPSIRHGSRAERGAGRRQSPAVARGAAATAARTARRGQNNAAGRRDSTGAAGSAAARSGAISATHRHKAGTSLVRGVDLGLALLVGAPLVIMAFFRFRFVTPCGHDVSPLSSSRPATAGRGTARSADGGRGAGRNAPPASTTNRRVRGPLHHPAAQGGPPPRFRGGGCSVLRSRARLRPRVLPINNVPNRHLRGAKRRSNPERSGRTGLLRFARNDEQIKKGSGTPADAVVHDPHATARGARHGEGGLRRPSASGALACRRSTHGTCGSDRTPPLSSSSRTSWDGTTEGRVLPTPGRPSAAGVMSPQAGRRAGRAFWPGAARERTANPPAGTVLAPPAGLPPEGVLSGRGGA